MMNYTNLFPPPKVPPSLLGEYLFAHQYGVRVVIFTSLYGNQHLSVPEKGWATHCSYGPKGGHYVHIITDSLRKVTRGASSVQYDYHWNR